MKFRQRQNVVTARQWDPAHDPMWGVVERGACLSAGHPAFIFAAGMRLEDSSSWGWLGSLEGGRVVRPGDWIVTDAQGGRRVVCPFEFERDYMEVEE